MKLSLVSKNDNVVTPVHVGVDISQPGFSQNNVMSKLGDSESALHLVCTQPYRTSEGTGACPRMPIRKTDVALVRFDATTDAMHKLLVDGVNLSTPIDEQCGFCTIGGTRYGQKNVGVGMRCRSPIRCIRLVVHSCNDSR